MIFHFRDLETLRLALTSAVVPPEVVQAPARAAVADSQVWIEPEAAAPRSLGSALKKLGVSSVRSAPAELSLRLHCWAQALPLARDSGPMPLTAQTPVLFELSDPAQLGGLVGEMLRLGNDRQGYRFLADADDRHTVLLRVIGPPYYSLLRALEPSGGTATIRAYFEPVPRVWVEAGWSHPLVEHVRPPDGQQLLLRPERDWEFVADEPFRDIYEVLEFTLPTSPAAWKDTAPTRKLTVSLRLAPGNPIDPAELWVLTDEAFDALDTLVRDSDERLINRLMFAVGQAGSKPVVVLRTRPSKLPPPVLVLDATAYKPYLRLPNLFLPVGTRLHPPLRRDAVRRLLADDPAVITWLAPLEEGGFAPHRLPDDAFRPLTDWVEYVLDHDRPAIVEWMQAARFDFASFICRDASSPAPPPPPKVGGKPRQTPSGSSASPGDPDIIEAEVVKKGRRIEDKRGPSQALPAMLPPSELQVRLAELEAEFQSLPGDLDAPGRVRLWPEMARLNAAREHHVDAALCWVNALWLTTDAPLDWWENWAACELPKSAPEAALPRLDAFLKQSIPTHKDVRATAAVIAWASRQTPVPAALREQLPMAWRLLEQHHSSLGVRATWLAGTGLVRLGGRDLLGLTRLRDRILERLYTEGLTPELEIPTFLRIGDAPNGSPGRHVLETMRRLHPAAICWNNKKAGSTTTDPAVNRPYVELMFAYGFARLGEAQQARSLLQNATTELNDRGDEVHTFLLQAFGYRIEQVLQGKGNRGPLPVEYLEYLQEIEKQPSDGKKRRYIIDRLREQSRILEPNERFDPYLTWKKSNVAALEALKPLLNVTDPKLLGPRLERLVADSSKLKPEIRVQVLTSVLMLGPRVGEALTEKLLALVGPTLDALPDGTGLEHSAPLLERALILAGHYDRPNQVRELVNRFVALMKSPPGGAVLDVVGTLAGQTLRSLRKLGLRGEIQHLLAELADVILHGRSIAALRGAEPARWLPTLRSLLHLASGWLDCGDTTRALPVLDEARATLFDASEVDSSQKPAYVNVACAYAAALGLAPAELALPRFEELFARLHSLPNTWTSHTHYSRFHLNVVEAVVLGLTQDDLMFGPLARRWLEDDEYLIRRRIHADLREAMAHAGE